MTMVRRVAEALRIEDGAKHDVWLYESAARAALRAMRDPTESMSEAAYQAVEMSDAWCIEDDTHWRRSFTAAIDAALAEGKTTP